MNKCICFEPSFYVLPDELDDADVYDCEGARVLTCERRPTAEAIVELLNTLSPAEVMALSGCRCDASDHKEWRRELRARGHK